MKKTFQMQDLECANCAAKMENAIGKLPGVHNVTVSFISQKLILDAEDDLFDQILNEASKLVKKIEPDCRIVRR